MKPYTTDQLFDILGDCASIEEINVVWWYICLHKYKYSLNDLYGLKALVDTLVIIWK